MKYLYLVILILLLTSCASRGSIDKDNPIKPVTNLYSRNYIVAAPTLVGNTICGVPFYLLTSLVGAIYPGEKSDTYYSVMNGIVMVPASVCGVITGSVFVPVSYVCDENPWEINWRSYHADFKCSTDKNI